MRLRPLAIVAALSLGIANLPALAASPAPTDAGADPDLAAAAAELEALMDDHLWFGQVTSTAFGDASQTPGDVAGLYQVSDSALWTGVYLAGQAARFEVAGADGDQAERDAALARIREVADGLHRNITISRYWTPSTECSTETLPTAPEPTLDPGLDSPDQSCGLSLDGVTTGEPGRLFRACFPEGFPFQAQDPATRPPMIFGPIPWEDGQGWYCEDGTSRDQYAGVTFGLTAALDAVAGVEGLEDLTTQIAGDLMAMTGYLVRHGWSVVYPHTRVSTHGSENFVFPLFVQVPSARLNMAVTARHAAHVAGTLADQAFFDAVWDEEWAHFGSSQVTENLLAVQSPHQSYYVMNLQHLTAWDIVRWAPDIATRQAQKAYFAVLDETTRDDENAWFETLTYGMTGERWRHDLAVGHLREWLTYRDRVDDGIARSTPERCDVDFECVPQDEVNWYVDTTSGPQRTSQPGSSSTLRARVPLPVADRVSHHDFLWQRSPYELRASQPAQPTGREPGVDLLTPYWTLRWFEEVAQPAVTGMPDWAGPHTETRRDDWSGPNDAVPAVPFVPGQDDARHLVGSLHEHSGYSDGWFDTRPEDYYRSGKGYGLDFMGGADHSDTLGVPVSVSEACIDDQGVPVADCVPGDSDQVTDGVTKWDATKEQAANVTDASFSAFQGFEWTSDRYGHLDVFFSANQTGAKVDGGYADMATFWDWFTRAPELGGGADGIGTFNHPDAKDLSEVDGEETQNWNDLAFEPRADERMVGIEVFNDDDEFGTLRTTALAPNGFYAHALDKGWHLGPIGAEDLGHREDDAYGDDENNWGGPVWAKTVVVSEENTPAAIRAAMLARRFYAVGPNENDLRLALTADGQPMGSRLLRQTGQSVVLAGRVNAPDGLTLELVTNGGDVVATAVGSDLALAVPVAGDSETWYFLRVRRDGRPVAYSAPVWVNATSTPVTGEWLAGDLHVHTCYSHDGYCGVDDEGSETIEYEFDPTDPFDSDLNSDVYTLSGDISERFAEASVRGLDYLAITDHNDVRSSADPGFGSHGVLGVAGYENSLSGHAQMLGVREIYAHGNGAAAINTMADLLRGDGGVFQLNHPADSLATPLAGCTDADFGELDWGYGMAVVPDTMEVWNIGHYLQPPLPAGNSNDDSERFWECFLDAGHRIGATGGSDSHWLSLSLLQGVGNPTTWVFAPQRSERGILDALAAGRTSLTVLPPVQGGTPLLLEADADGDGVFEAAIGDTVTPGTTMRVRTANPVATGTVVVRANGATIVEEPLTPGGAVTFTGPDEGWAYAKLVDAAMPVEAEPVCDPFDGTPLDSSYCDNQLLVYGLTSPIYVAPAPTRLVVTTDPSAHATDVTTVCGVLTAANGPVPGQQVTLSLGDRTGTTTTGSDGRGCVSLLVDVDPGDAAVDGTFDGDERFEPATATTTLRVLAEPTITTITSASWFANLAHVSVQVVEHDGVPVVGGTVVVVAGDQSMTLTTDADGRASGTMQVVGSGGQTELLAIFVESTRLATSSDQRTLVRTV